MQDETQKRVLQWFRDHKTLVKQAVSIVVDRIDDADLLPQDSGGVRELVDSMFTMKIGRRMKAMITEGVVRELNLPE